MASTSKKPKRRSAKRTATVRLPADVTAAINAALDKKAIEIVVLDFRGTSAFTDAFLICTGTNIRQVQAIADSIDAALRTRGLTPSLVEGYERGEWILVDYFDFIVHIFTPVTREFYGLERLWADAKRIEIPAT